MNVSKCLLKLTLIVIKYFQYKKTQMTHKHTAIYMKTILKKIIQDSIIYSRHITKEKMKNNKKTGLRKQKGNSIIFIKKKNNNFLRLEFWGILESNGERELLVF